MEPVADRNRAVARRITFDLFAAGGLGLIEVLTAAGFVNHGQTPGVADSAGRASLANAVQRVRSAFPDLRYELLHEVAEGGLVVHHLLAHGTQHGPLGPMPATGKAASWREVHVMRFADGVMVEQWGVVDRLAILQQLGLAGPPGR